MTTADIMKIVIAALASVNVGSMLTIAAIYTWASVRAHGAGRGALLVRHVIEVAVAVGLLVAGTGWGVYSQVGTHATGPVVARLYMYGLAMLILLAALSDVGRHTRRRIRAYRPVPAPETPTPADPAPEPEATQTPRRTPPSTGGRHARKG